jgi:hypothetical protein
LFLPVLFITLKKGFVGVLFGYGNKTFEQIITYSTGSGFSSAIYFVDIADFNSENHYDMIVSDIPNNEVIIFYGDGNGTFQLARKYSTGFGSAPYGIAHAKFNNNNKTDIVVTLWGNGNVAVLTEYYAAQFEHQTIYSKGSAPQSYSVSVGDFNNDHRKDIAVINSGTDNLNILFGVGNETFETQKNYFLGTDYHPQYVITGDINNDNYLDIVTANSKHDSISIIMGHDNGTFAAQMMYSTGNGSYPLAVTIGDVNNDNRSDIVVTNSNTDSIGILFQFDYTSFQRGNSYSSEDGMAPWPIIVNDFNSDNCLDIATAFYKSDKIGILLGHCNGSFGVIISHPTGNDSLPLSSVTYDFNNDNRLDIAVANYGTNNILILLGYGNGSFVTTTTYSTGEDSAPSSIVITNINNDNQIDMLVTNSFTNNFGVFIGCGNATFASIVTYSTGYDSTPISIIVGDFNSDSQLDIAVANYVSSNIGIFLGYGNGSFDSQVTDSTGYHSWPNCATVEDFNKDNRLDIAVANSYSNNVGILLGYGNGTFAPVTTYSTGDGSVPTFICVYDFNNDNEQDIAVANYATNNIVVLYGSRDRSFFIRNSM